MGKAKTNKRLNYGEKILTMQQFLNYYFNDNYGQVEDCHDELSQFYSELLNYSHRDVDNYFEDLKEELLELEDKETLEHLKQEITILSNEQKCIADFFVSTTVKSKIMDKTVNNLNDLQRKKVELEHIDDLLFACDELHRLPNDEVKKYDVLKGDAILVADCRNNVAYYANPCSILDDEISYYDMLNATKEEKEEYTRRRIAKVLRKDDKHDKYQRR